VQSQKIETEKECNINMTDYGVFFSHTSL